MIRDVALCTVVYNEIERLPKLIAHAQSIGVSEICIVDQQSTDGTWEWLNDNRAEKDLKIVQDVHWGYCEPSRIKAHEMSTSEWILVLDADENVSNDFLLAHREVDEIGYFGMRMKRAFYLGGEHRFTGDYQFRYFQRESVRYLKEIHTDPQSRISEHSIWSPDFVAIEHNKSWVEQIRDELAYEALIGEPKNESDRLKLALNVHLKLLREKGITAEEADDMTLEERKTYGLSE